MLSVFENKIVAKKQSTKMHMSKCMCRLRRMAVLGLFVGLTACAGQGSVNSVGGLSNAHVSTTSQKTLSAMGIGDRILFDTDSSDLTPQAIQILDQQIAWLQRNRNVRVSIEGHADERGTREYNIALGARRAATVRSYMISKGLSGNRINTTSFGKERPVAVCNNISCWSQNRRAVTLLADA